MQEKKHWKKNKIASGIGIGIVSLVLFIMVFGIDSGNGSYGKWEVSKNTPNELGKWVVYYNYVDLSELKKKQTVDFCWGELIDGKIHAKIKYEDLDKYLKSKKSKCSSHLLFL